jgi:hypothetical protein
MKDWTYDAVSWSHLDVTGSLNTILFPAEIFIWKGYVFRQFEPLTKTLTIQPLGFTPAAMKTRTDYENRFRKIFRESLKTTCGRC